MCSTPLLARYTTLNLETNKCRIKLINRLDLSYEDAKEKFGDDLLLLPCGHCPDCLKAYSFEWSVRLMAESLYHDKKCFLTLTYDDKHLPPLRAVYDPVTGEVVKTYHPLRKKDLQDFFKRLRKHFPDNKICYFACGEYGENGTHRCHYHVILYGLDFDDKKVIKFNELKQPLYTSKTLESIWKNGIVSIGEVTAHSCGYVARYSLKKRISYSKSDEFLLMSRRPAIGQRFFEDNASDIYLSDRVYINDCLSTKVPRFFDRKAEASDDVLVNYFYELSKQRRAVSAKGHEYENLKHFGVDRIEKAQLIQFARSLESMKILKRSNEL